MSQSQIWTPELITLGLLASLLLAVLVALIRQRRIHANVLQQNLKLQQELNECSQALSALDSRVDEKAHQIHELQQELHLQRAAKEQAQLQQQRVQALLDSKEQHHKEQLQQLESNKETLRQNFSQLAQEVLDTKSKAMGEQHQQQLAHLLTPFKEQLADFRHKVDNARREDAEGRAALKQQLESLQQLNQRITDEASSLTQALKGDKKLQGNWGEIQVEKLLENSGLIKGQEYQREPNFKDDDGNNFRPDFIVHLPEGKHLIIDSKVSLVDYLAYVDADDEDEKKRALQRHVQCIRQHIQSLSKKDYSSLPGMSSPDFVFMFLPIEPAFLVAFQHEQSLFNDAFAQHIVVVTPTTLLATLRTVANLWSVERQNASARILADKAAGLYNKLRIFVEKMEKLDGQFVTARKTYDEALATLKTGPGNVVKQAQEFLELGVRVKKELPAHTLQTAELSSDSATQSTQDNVSSLENAKTISK